MNDNNELQPVEGDESRRRLVLAMLGVVILGLCALFVLAFLWFQPDQLSLLGRYFPSPTPTLRPTRTPAPTQTPIPNLTATQRAWIKPSQPPSLGSAEEARNAADSGVSILEQFAMVYPDTPDINQPGDIYIFEITLDESMPVIWEYGWCTTTQEILEENFSHIEIAFTVNEVPVPLGNFAIIDVQNADDSACRRYSAIVNTWPPGQHHLESQVTFTQDIHDGFNPYPAGTHVFKYIVTVNP